MKWGILETGYEMTKSIGEWNSTNVEELSKSINANKFQYNNLEVYSDNLISLLTTFCYNKE